LRTFDRFLTHVFHLLPNFRQWKQKRGRCCGETADRGVLQSPRVRVQIPAAPLMVPTRVGMEPFLLLKR
jgi:hypothetical protein